MGKKASAPPPVDYTAAANAQGQNNRQAALATASMSNPNMNTPTGSRRISYAKDPNTGEFTPTITDELTPDAQKAFEAQQRVDLALSQLGEQGIGRVQDVMGKGFNYTGPGIQTKLDLSNAAKMPVDAGTTGQEAIMKRLQPQLQFKHAQFETDMANKGIAPGSEAYQNSLADQTQQENDLVSQAALQGINVDMAARNQAVNEALQSGQFGNTADQQEFARQLGLYNLPLNQISALMSGSQIQMPQFQGYSGANIAASPLFQATQANAQDAMARYNAEQSANNAMTQGLFSLAGSAIGGAGNAGGFSKLFG
jgi:hypothetical protein